MERKSMFNLHPTIVRGDGQDESIQADDHPPSSSHQGRGGWWWWRRWRWCVVATVLMVIVVMVMRQLYIHRTNYKFNIGVGGVGVLVCGCGDDEDILSAVHQAVKDAGVVSVAVQVGVTGGTAAGVVAAYTQLWQAGVRVFVVGLTGVEVEVLCGHVQHTGHKAILVSPTATPVPTCPNLHTLAPPTEAIIAAEMEWARRASVTGLVPVMVEGQGNGMQLLHQLENMATDREIELLFPVLLNPHNLTTQHLAKTLAAWPKAGVWVAAGDLLAQVMAEVGHHMQGHFVLLHTHHGPITALMNHPAGRQAAENCSVVRVAWAGAKRMVHTATRHLVATLRPYDPLLATLSYNAANLALQLATAAQGHNPPLSTVMAAHGLTLPMIQQGQTNTTGGTMSGWAVRLRLVGQGMLGGVVVQDSPWLLEGESWLQHTSPTWTVTETHTPVRIITRKEFQNLARQASCSTPSWINVTAHDPLTHQSVNKMWPSLITPQVLMVPNASPAGFTVRVWCEGRETHTLEIGCRGASIHNNSVQCVTAMSDGQGGRVRVVRSVQLAHGYPNPDEYYNDVDYNEYEELDDLDYYEYEEPGPIEIVIRKLKGLLRHPDFKTIVPQIGGCISAAGGCAVCFTYILSLNASVSPGVCYGACGAGVGGSCATLFFRGIQYKMDHTVICSELFHQGRLSLTSYLADASYGARLAVRHPQALRGYQLVATPLVAVMRISSGISDLVEAAAKPWIRHMEYEEGITDTDDILGYIITTLGLPLCSLLALLTDFTPSLTLLAILAALWPRPST